MRPATPILASSPRAAGVYENSTGRRLGYLLEHFGHARQAASRRPLARKVKSLKPRDPSVRLVASLARSAKVSEAPTWKLTLNVPLEIDVWFAELNRLAAEPFMPKGRRSPPRQDETCDDDGN